MKVSIITVVFNACSTVDEAIRSVLGQSYPAIEYIIIDGGSTDGTMEIIHRYKNRIAKIISAPDKGIYDAMNKGIALATADVIGILNADDTYANNAVVADVVSQMIKTGADLCYGDLVYVDCFAADKIVRYWKAGSYHKGSFRFGWMPPHPTVFVKRYLYHNYGAFDLSLGVCADHEILLRWMYLHKVTACYIPRVLIKMRLGGASNKSIQGVIRQNMGIVKTLRKYEIHVTPLFFIIKLGARLKQFLLR